MMPSIYLRTGFIVLAFHGVILCFMVYRSHGTVDKTSNFVLVREIVELESAVISKAIDRHPASKKSTSKSSTTINHVYLDGHEQLNQAQVHFAAAAPVTMPSADSLSLNNPKPPYPISSRENGEQGRVHLTACIDEYGKIDRLDLYQSSGHPALDRSALNAVRRWEFIPAHQNGKAVAICYRLPINFVLSHHRNFH